MGELKSMRSEALDPEAMRAVTTAYQLAAAQVSEWMTVDDDVRAQIAIGIVRLCNLGVRDATLLRDEGIRQAIAMRLDTLCATEA